MTIEEFEKLIWLHEKIRVIVRKPKDTKLPIREWQFVHACQKDFTVTRFIRDRLLHKTTAVLSEDDCVVLSSTGEMPRWNTQIQNVRATYT